MLDNATTYNLFVIIKLQHLLYDIANMHHLEEFSQRRYVYAVQGIHIWGICLQVLTSPITHKIDQESS